MRGRADACVSTSIAEQHFPDLAFSISASNFCTSGQASAAASDFVTFQTGVLNTFFPILPCSSTGTKIRARHPPFFG